MTCSHCNAPLVDERCATCDRTPAWCRCDATAVRREPLWLTRSRERRGGLAKDLSLAA